uniref:TROVE domain-containing protein n=1 Tax=Timema cristinae TaxID=61476 RepID=A0A7R9HBK0_TIMCR|nr:unnamed protein product [Timema cristinae]
MTTSPETRLKRFLHYGRETGLYQPGNRLLQDYYVRDNLGAINTLVSEGKATETVSHIVKAFSDGYSAHPESLVFALAMCARTDNQALQQAAYNAVKTVCKAPRFLFLFVMFNDKLADPVSGRGHGWRRVVNEWYLQKTPLELAELVTRYRKRCGWSHKDIFKSSHIKSADVGQQAVIKYVVRGLKEAKEQFSERPEAQQVLAYLQNVEDFKHCEDEQHAARLLEIHSLSLEHIPSHFIKSKEVVNLSLFQEVINSPLYQEHSKSQEVINPPLYQDHSKFQEVINPPLYQEHGISQEIWNAIIPFLSLPDLVGNLKRLARLRLLKGNQPIVSKVVDALNNQATLADANLHPAQVLLALRNYENMNKNIPLVLPTGHIVLPLPSLPQPHVKVVHALNHLLTSSFKLLVPTGMRYLVAVDVRSQMVHGKCWQCSNVTPAQAAILQALCLVKAERDVTVLAFGADEVLIPVTLDREITLQQAQDRFKEIPNGPVDLTQPILWAKKNRKPVDVFVVLTDNQVKPGKVKPAVAIQQYRSALHLPNTKFVTCALSCSQIVVANPNDPLMLDIAGYDGHVPRIIEAFSRGAF